MKQGDVYLVFRSLTLFVILSTLFVGASALTVSGNNVDYRFTEDSYSEHNLTKNASGVVGDLTISIDTSRKSSWDNGNGFINYTGISSFSWITLDSNGILSFNATNDNQTGRFLLPIQFDDSSGGGVIEVFNFTINATNDIPFFTSISSNYTINSTTLANSYFVNLSDFESHYPLNFSIDFNSSCVHASWLGLVDGQNCSLLNLVNVSNESAYFNYSYDALDVGVYYAQINVTEAAHSCPHNYCADSYLVPQSVLYNVTIEVVGSLQVNTTGCGDVTFIEGTSSSCNLSVRTQGNTNTINVSSLASFRYYNGTVSNTTWFFPDTILTGSNFLSSFNSSINATHDLVGNWTINISVIDLNTSEFNWSTFNVSVGSLGNVAPNLSGFESNINLSIDANLNYTGTILDYDFSIEDKAFYNESIIVSVSVVNYSTSLSVSEFVRVFNETGSGNKTFVKVNFYPNSSHRGTYNVTVIAIDASGVSSLQQFNLTISSNTAPLWNSTNYSFDFTVNSTLGTTITNLTNLNLSLFTSDNDTGDVLSYALVGTYPAGVSVTGGGILNFAPWKYDVGNYSFQIKVTDTLGLSAFSTWNFSVANINSDPSHVSAQFTIDGSNVFVKTVTQGNTVTVSFISYDEDLNITDTEVFEGAYNEVLSVFVNVSNTSFVFTPLNFSFSGAVLTGNAIQYTTSFVPISNNSGNYTVVINITDASGASDTITFNLTVDPLNSNPVVQNITNQSVAVTNTSYSLFVNASDDEDDRDGKLLNYTLDSLTAGAPPLVINKTTGEISFNFGSNESYAGIYYYNLSVNDSNSTYDYTQFFLTVYGTPVIVLPTASSTYSLVENSSNLLLFNVSYGLSNANLTYYISYDNITYNISNYIYSSLVSESSRSYLYDSSSNLSIYFNTSFYDETFGFLKNLTLYVASTDYPSLSTTVAYKLNISHVNSPVTNTATIGSVTGTSGTATTINLSAYFSDLDIGEGLYNDSIIYVMLGGNSTDAVLTSLSSISGEILSLFVPTGVTGTYNISIMAQEYNSSNVSVVNASTPYFTVIFNAVTSTTITSSGGGGSSTRIVVERYALKVISPGDIEVSPDDFIDLNFSLLNNGFVDLSDIDLSALIYLDDLFDDGVRITFTENYIDTLAVGESVDLGLRVLVDTSAAGEYRVVVNGTVGSPAFSDWGEFFVKVQSATEGELSQLLLFIEKLVSENPVCLELQEHLDEAQVYFDAGNISESERVAQEVISACEDAIGANEQIRFFDDDVGLNLLYGVILSTTLLIFGFIYYIYRRIKFKNSIDSDYI
ncbi:MAG: hypothetical protein ACI83O_000836 [Patescibacteria group bacterium]|jgi:hypothetical protein